MRNLITFAAVMLLSFIIWKDVSAQDSDLQKYSQAFTQYRLEYNEYLTSHDQYVLSKKQYEQYKTLASKEKLQNDTVMMLMNREEVMSAYYQVLSVKLGDSLIDISDEKKSGFQGALTSEIEWMNSHKSGYSTSDSLPTLSSESDEADLRVNDFQDEIYKILYAIHRGKLDRYNSRNAVLYNDLFLLTEKIKSEQRDEYKLSDVKIEVINRWFGEIDLKYSKYVTLLGEADTQIEKAAGKGSKVSYNRSIAILVEALTNLLERVVNAKEIASEIKISEI